MTQHLRRPYTFARDTANYSATGKPWDGQPKLATPAPTDALLNAGFTPDTGVDPQLANSLESDKADAISVAGHLALRGWSAAPWIDSIDSTAPHFILPVSPEGSAAQLGARSVQAKIMALVCQDAGSGHTHKKLFANDPGVVSGSTATFTSLACAATDDGGAGTSGSAIFGCETGSNACHYYSISSGAWFTFTPGLTGQATACFATPNSGHYLISDTFSGNIRYATSLTGSWSSASFGSAGDAVTQYAAGNGVVCCVVKTLTPTYRVMYSGTDGTSWNTGHSFGANAISLTFNSAYGLFVVIDATGAVWISPDGATWNLNKTASVLATGISPGAQRFASLGYAIVHLINRSTSTQKLRGVAYSFDLGATWNEWYFAEYTNGLDLSVLVTIDGTLWASNSQTLWRSGRLSVPNVQYTGV